MKRGRVHPFSGQKEIKEDWMTIEEDEYGERTITISVYNVVHTVYLTDGEWHDLMLNHNNLATREPMKFREAFVRRGLIYHGDVGKPKGRYHK